MLGLYPLSVISGFSIALANDCTHAALASAGLLASGAIQFPAAPEHGQPLTISTIQAITTLALQAAPGQSLTTLSVAMSAASSKSWRYYSPTCTWYPA